MLNRPLVLSKQAHARVDLLDPPGIRVLGDLIRRPVGRGRDAVGHGLRYLLRCVAASPQIAEPDLQGVRARHVVQCDSGGNGIALVLPQLGDGTGPERADHSGLGRHRDRVGGHERSGLQVHVPVRHHLRHAGVEQKPAAQGRLPRDLPEAVGIPPSVPGRFG